MFIERQRRVVVTGLGILTSLGVGKDIVLKRLFAGEGNIQRLDGAEYSRLPCRVASYVPSGNEVGGINLSDRFTNSELKMMSRATAFALVAAKEALDDADFLPIPEEDKERTGVAVGMGMVPLHDVVDTGLGLQRDGYGKLSPFFIPRILTNLAAGHLSIRYGLLGPNHSVATACATGAHAIGDAYRFIKNGDADVMLCGGTEAPICPLSIAAFAKMRALSTRYNDTPAKASRPFDKQRDGFVMGEGAGILLLESLEHAERRGAKVYAEILGYGLSGDGHHMTAPRDDGLGAYLSMKSALRGAKVDPEMVGYINAHATSTPLGDAAEVKAIHDLFGAHCNSIAVSSTKGAIGHLLGAAGSVEAIFTVMSCFHGIVPPTINLEQPGIDLNLNFVPKESQPFPNILSNQRVALTNSFGFGGTNASLCISSV